jgi:hypothetical protein
LFGTKKEDAKKKAYVTRIPFASPSTVPYLFAAKAAPFPAELQRQGKIIIDT